MDASLVKTTSICRTNPLTNSHPSPTYSVLSHLPRVDTSEEVAKPLSSLSQHRYGMMVVPHGTTTSSSSSNSPLGSIFGHRDKDVFLGPTLTTLQALESACDIASQVMDLLGYADDDDDDDDDVVVEGSLGRSNQHDVRPLRQ